MALEVGEILEGKVTGITNFGAFVELPEGKSGMVHISEVAPTFVKEIKDHVTEGQTVKVKVLNITEEGKISLSIKRAMTPPVQQQQRSNDSFGNRGGQRPRNNNNNYTPEPPKRNEPISFEEMLSNFKKTSDEKMSDLKKATESKHGGYSRRGKGNDLKGWE